MLDNSFAVIFDVDGVIVDSNPYHIKAWEIFCKKNSIKSFDENFKKRMFGKSTKEILEKLFGKKLSPDLIQKYAKEKDSLYLEVFKENIKPTKGLIKFLDILQQKNIIRAVATSEPVDVAKFILKRTGVYNYFSTIVYGTQVKNPKPEPEIYLKVVKEINLYPSKCVVIEDSVVGVEAAKRAGMKAIGITTTYSKGDLNKADFVIKDFSELSIEKVSSLVLC